MTSAGNAPMARLQVSTATSGGRNLYLLRELARLPQWAALGRPLKVLSFGCSAGYECLDIRQVFPDAEVHGCDINPVALAEAKARCGDAILVYESSDAALLRHGPYDLIVAFHVFCRYPHTEGKDEIAAYFRLGELDEGLRQLDRGLRPGGVLALYNTPYFFEDSCLAGRYQPAAGQDFADNGWMAKCDAGGRRLTLPRVLVEGELRTVSEHARAVREGGEDRLYGDPRVAVIQQPLSAEPLPGSVRTVAWRKPLVESAGALAVAADRHDWPVVTSFYSGDAYYHEAAQWLRDDCARLGLDCDIVELPTVPGEGWIQRCRRKSAFFLQQLRKHQRPILWLDVDCRLAARPEMLKGGGPDVAAFLRDFKYLREFDAAVETRSLHPGILYFNHTPAGLAFAAAIADLEAQQTGLVATDDYFLQEAWLQHRERLNLLLLSPDCVSFEWPVAGAQTFYFGRSGQVSQHLGQAAQHAVPAQATARRKTVLLREAAELGRTSRPQEALVLMRRAHELDPDDAALVLRLARLTWRVGQQELALSQLQDWVRHRPGGPDLANRFALEQAQHEGDLRRIDATLRTLRGSPFAEDHALADSAALRLGLEQRALAAGLIPSQRPALWWMETPWPGNLGDILNPYLVEALSGLPPRPVAKGKGLLAIGSVIKFAQAGSVVWGSGTPRLSDAPSPQATYLAVRGPLTRELVLRHGGQCGPVMGDPAALLPLVYQPKTTGSRHRLGWVGHFTHDGAVQVGPGVRQIPILRAGYAGIEAFIDELLGCEAVLSSSLHGLIIAHAYGIPARWCEVRGSAQSLPGDGTKFRDYLLSVGVAAAEPLVLNAGDVIEAALADGVPPLPPVPINCLALLEAAPFPVKPEVLARAAARAAAGRSA